ncbi:MAG TPA: agmatine deiminase family protein [Candidatus Binataceae bacterium]|jgi:agmatine deiminase|nr:agmatine deiminase family protein [Candidatus Binataceae bacterium]
MAAPIPQEIRRRLAGYRMPAEWEPHRATYLTWPHNLETWPGKFDPVPAQYAAIAAALSRFETVRMLVKDAGAAEQTDALLRRADARMESVEFLTCSTNDSWIRDYGPVFVRRADGQQVALDWKFNSWGEKYGPHELDDAIPHRLAARYGFECVDVPMVLEGGSIDVNGAGSLLTTESCLLNPNRNPDMSREEIEEYLHVYLGVSNILWLGDGIAGDDTDGHVDDLARFVSPNTIVTVIEHDRADDNCRPLAENLERLRAMRDQNGKPFRIETLPMPPALYHEGQRLPASYANFYIANGAVLVPTFGCPTDEQALTILARLFPGRKVLGFLCLDLVWGLGTIHCLSQQHPG